MIDDKLLDEIEERANKATPAPWELEKDTGRLFFRYDDDYCEYIVDYWNTDTAEFIAHAREDIPALVAEVRRLRAIQGKPVFGECCEWKHLWPNGWKSSCGNGSLQIFDFCPYCGRKIVMGE